MDKIFLLARTPENIKILDVFTSNLINKNDEKEITINMENYQNKKAEDNIKEINNKELKEEKDLLNKEDSCSDVSNSNNNSINNYITNVGYNFSKQKIKPKKIQENSGKKNKAIKNYLKDIDNKEKDNKLFKSDGLTDNIINKNTKELELSSGKIIYKNPNENISFKTYKTPNDNYKNNKNIFPKLEVKNTKSNNGSLGKIKENLNLKNNINFHKIDNNDDKRFYCIKQFYKKPDCRVLSRIDKLYLNLKDKEKKIENIIEPFLSRNILAKKKKKY
jgi:hypothetical protein